MGAARTLLRKQPRRVIRDEDGEVIEQRRVRRGTPFRRVVTLHDAPVGIEHTYHVTKGHRFVRITT